MKLPIQWLKRYIDVASSADVLAEELTLSGTKVEEVVGTGPEAVIDIEITSNRPDCLSILGLAREVSAITGKKLKVPAAYTAAEKGSARGRSGVDILIEDKKACPRYTARVLRNARIAPAPTEIQRLLNACSSRPISNVVDATNFVLFECGQPMHAFDLDKIEGGRIIVRRSRSGEKFLGIDGIEYTLDDKTLVIADSRGPIAIAGVIGGKATEVGPNTKNILLESAYFDPVTVRQASKKYKITTESSYRFERGVNPETVAKASRRGADLIREWAGAVEEGGLIDKDHQPRSKAKSVVLRLERMERLLGLRISASRAASILKSLGFSVSSSKTRLSVRSWSERRDIAREADLIEEVLRIEGFDKAPVTLPVTRHTYESARDPKAEGLFRLKEYLAALGLQEIMTYSLLSAKKLSQAGSDPTQARRVVNGASAEQEYFRPDLLTGMLEALLFNAHRKATGLRFFEIGNRISGQKEETVLSIALYGAMEENWARKSQASFYDLKGIVENVLHFTGIRSFEWTAGPSLTQCSSGADLMAERQVIGTVGELSASIQRKWDLPHPVFYAELRLEPLFGAAPARSKVHAVAKFPIVSRDIAFIIDNRVSVKDLEEAMLHAASPYLCRAVLFDQFTGKNIAQGKRSLAFALSYQKEDGTFTDPEIQTLQDSVRLALKRLYQVEFR